MEYIGNNFSMFKKEWVKMTARSKKLTLEVTKSMLVDMNKLGKAKYANLIEWMIKNIK